jgi:hypothetical protein
VTFDDRNDWFPHLSPDEQSMVFLAYEAGLIGHPPEKDVELRLTSLQGWKNARAEQALRQAGNDQRSLLVARRTNAGPG